MGFDELLLDDFHYPREGRMSRIKTDERTMTQQEALALLADDIHTALEQAGYKGQASPSAWTRTSRLRAARQTPAS